MRRRTFIGAFIALGLIACANEASELLGDMLVDAGNGIRDAGGNGASAQPLKWEKVTCEAESPYTVTRVSTNANGRTTTTTTQTTVYAHYWEGEPEDWLARFFQKVAHDPCSSYANIENTNCTLSPTDPHPLTFAYYVGHPQSNGDGQLMVRCGAHTVSESVTRDSAGDIISESQTVTPYDPEAMIYWKAKR